MVMLLSNPKGDEYKKLLTDKNWIAEFKRDGNRLIFEYNNGKFEFKNRSGTIFTKKIDTKLLDTIKRFSDGNNYAKQFILDGEYVFIDKDGKDHRTQAQCVEAKPYYVVFDILELNGENLKNRPWAERKHELLILMQEYNLEPKAGSHFIFMQHYMDKQQVLDVAKQLGMEGIVLKKIDGKYIDGRSKECIKIKFIETDEFIVIGYTEASKKNINSKGKEIDNKRYPYFKALCLAQYDKKGKLKSKAMIGGGFKDVDLKVVTKLLNKKKHSWSIYDCNINDIGHNLTDKNYGVPKETVHWLKEKYYFIIEIKMSGKTEYGNPFQPRFLALRLDKKMNECKE